MCRRPRSVFDYRSDHHTRTPRGGDGDITSFEASVGNLTRRFRGLEVLLREHFTRPGEPLCCGSIRKATYRRYSAKRDRYVRYRTIIRYGKPLPR
jgi:hypothetical protein